MYKTKNDTYDRLLDTKLATHRKFVNITVPWENSFFYIESGLTGVAGATTATMLDPPLVTTDKCP